MNGFARRLVLAKERQKTTRKWPIKGDFLQANKKSKSFIIWIGSNIGRKC